MKRSLDYLKKDVLDILGDGSSVLSENSIYKEMLFNVGLLRKEKLDLAELRLLNTAFRELRHALKVFKSYRSIRKAAIFGSARTPKHHPDYKMATAFGRKLAKKGWMLITGGASGIMEAAMAGAGVKKSFGLNIMLPFEQKANPIIKGNLKLMYFKFPGGFGTFDEGFESFTLVQTGKAKPRPLVLVDTPGSDFWKSSLALFKQNMEVTRLISPGDLSLMRHFQNVDQAVNEVAGFYRNYHSSRFFKSKYLIRLKKKLPKDTLKKLHREFGDLLAEGHFERLTDLTYEDEKNRRLERIVFQFDRENFSRLRHLIDYFNTL